MERISLYSIIFLILFAGCSPYKKVQKHWVAIQEEIKKHPELVDSLKLVRRDTVESVVFRDSIVYYESPTDWNSWMLSYIDSLASNEINSKGEAKIQAAGKLQKAICPAVSKDTTYYQELYNSRITLYVPIRLSVRASGGVLKVKVESEKTKMPDPQVITEVKFQPLTPKFYRVSWFWFFLVAVLLLILSLTRRR